MLYALAGKEEKMNELFEKADEQTKKEIKLYQEDVSFFFPNHKGEDLREIGDKGKGDKKGSDDVNGKEMVLSKELDEKVSLSKKLDKEVVSDEDLNVPFHDPEEDKVNDMGFSNMALDKKQSLDEKFEFINNEDIFEDLKNSSSDKETNYSTLNNESVDTKIYSSSEEDYAI
ncbi:hypothetical protein NBO_70g0013 [Nosema bombycis CQ1]|uniref:Uncharacterized protein n=1 Tax=Nosema bombycis (strain CQ1 / CVCC 102059) TaxID=578461 RepID=R0M690_NOSB1|nr:hypothetical protein NBO_70g0013 [Nosema bombycis CQ1]|eukprot:EOB13504.1 hypothetical protein NBO_70g0013 [Nosema bombycis CQ1]